jgi:hypothetical protein
MGCNYDNKEPGRHWLTMNPAFELVFAVAIGHKSPGYISFRFIRCYDLTKNEC